jgi:NitT/TauT family transport system substrate-binding protein
MTDRQHLPTRSKALTTFAAGIAFIGLGRGISAQTTSVKVGSVGGLSDAGIYLAQAYGYFSKAGITVDQQLSTSAPPLMQALAVSQLDVAGISLTPGLFASQGMHIELRIVGDKQSYLNGFSGMRLIVRPNLVQRDKAATIAALRGKNVAIAAKGSVSYFLLDRALASVKLSLRDINLIELTYPNMFPAFTTGAIDAAINLEPFLTQTLIAGAAKHVSSMVEFAPGGRMTNVPLVYSEKFAKNRALAQAFFTAYTRGVRDYNDAFTKGKDKERVIGIMARAAKLEPGVVRTSYPFGLDPDQRVTSGAFDEVQHFFAREHMLETPAHISDLVDTSFAEAAIASLGHYKP